MSREFEFVRPPEAPVFEPTEEEFVDALAYIAKIKPIAEKTGICKIRPPAKWQPPFAIDIENFRFTPRVQRLNELEALSRIKLNFLDRLARFWELQGYRLRIPNVERKSLDLHGIHKIVHEEGGFENVCRERRWTYVGIRLGFGASVHKGGVTSALRNHYERILYPFDLFEAGVSLEPSKWKDFIANSRMPPKPTPHPSKKTPPVSKRSRRAETKVDEIDYSANKELRKLQFFGPGPKAAVPAVKNEEDMTEEECRNPTETTDALLETPVLQEVKEEPSEEKKEDVEKEKREKENVRVEPEATEIVEEKEEKKIEENEKCAEEVSPSKAETSKDPPKSRMGTRNAFEQSSSSVVSGMRSTKSVIVSFSDAGSTDPAPYKAAESASKTLEQYNCCVCQEGDREAQLLLCDECDDAYHTFCLVPPLPDVPRGDWRCPQCVAKVCNRPPVEYGFEQSKKQYTLQEFGEMADQFKVNYFKKDIHEVAYDKLEFEFWRLLQSLGEDVVVEYGADIHAAEKGSGFPTKPDALAEEDRHYTESAWNLNVLPVVDRSVLRFIGMDISGMKIPWCYVGMCFSCFCWHIEDHWSYSINYMHWGEPKTWYGVSSHDADLFENAMKSHAPELFEQSPDLLHHITTIMNPNILQRAGVPIYRTDQHAGEFIITFPRAYHAGFNNGYNFAEAVNFCPADWLPMGRQCVEHYATLRRTCVFSHDETVCKMASRTTALDVETAAVVALEMEEMLDRERQLRRRLLDAGVRSTQREEFELLADDHRMCVCCRTTCFLSAVTCKCGSATRMACARHADDLCSCEPGRRTLRYRYSLDELAAMIAKLRERVDSFSAWRKQVKAWLRMTGGPNEKPTLSQVQAHLEEAKRKDYAAKDEKAANLVKRLRSILSEAEALGKVAKDFFVHERRRATRLRVDNPLAKLAVDDFFKFAEAIERLPCQVPDVLQMCNLRNRIESFQTEAKRQLSSDRADRDVKRIEELLDFGGAQDIALPEVFELKKLLERERWLQNVDQLLSPRLEVKQEAMEEDEEGGETDRLGLPGAGDVELGQVCSLIETGEALQDRPEVLEALERLRNLKMRGIELEDQAARHLGSRSSPEEVARFLSEDAAEVVKGSDPRLLYLPNVEELRRALQTARKWYGDYSQQLNTGGAHYPTINTLEALLDRAQRCRVRVAPKKVDKLDAQVRLARGWHEQTSRFFLKRRASSSITLLELLLPRTPRSFDAAATPFHSMPRTTSRPPSKSSKSGSPPVSAGQENCQEFAREMNKENMDCATAYSAMVAAEVEAAKEWRARNAKRSEDENALYCLCRREQSDFMLQCDLCRDWFHAECIALPKVLEKAAALSCNRKLSSPDRKKGKKGKSKKGMSSKGSNAWAGRESQVRDLKYLCPRCQRGRRPQLGTIYGLLLSLQQLPVRMPEGEALQLLTERAMAWQDSVHAFLSGGPPDVRTAFAAYARLWSVELPPELATKMPAIDLDDEDDETLMQLQVRLREESRSHIEALLLQGDLIEVSLEETKWLWQLLQMSQPRAQPSISMEDPEEEVAVEEEEVEAAAEEEVEAAAEEVKVDVETVEEPPAKAARLES